ncbi:MAG: daunorubicin/doxorubicin resistance ABC transporter ATP-binding protein DrrA [Leptospiraceae bacterium]|nr:daunorubicin/doxorubicin resistance ABC transporter ATP-binding protein DrrA [Leptospiraceae bacterium]
MKAIETEGIKKRYGSNWALSGIDLSIEAGTVYGLLGPNGAGKTTTVGILTTLLKPDGGRAQVMGFDVLSQSDEVRRRISLTGQYASVDEDLTGLENLILIGRLFGFGWKGARLRAEELLEAFDLASSGKNLVRTYSGGMRRRLDVAAGLVVHSDVVFLDEPTTGLDPRSRNQVWDIVRAIAKQGATVLLTTQYMEEADRLAQRLAVIDHGKVIAEGTGRDLKSQVGANLLHIRLYSAADAKRTGTELRKMKLSVNPGSDAFSLTASIEKDDQISRVFHSLTKKGLKMAEFSVAQPSMDEVFFALTGHAPVSEEKEGAVQ